MGSDATVVLGNKKKAVWMLIASTIFVAGSVAIIRIDVQEGWGAVVFFGLCLLVSLYMLTPNAIRLTIDKNGIEMKTLRKPMRLAWNDVERFYVVEIRTGLATIKFIGIKYSPTLSRMDGALPNHFSKPAEELCQLLNDAKRRWSQSI